eukprot:IDg10999t1
MRGAHCGMGLKDKMFAKIQELFAKSHHVTAMELWWKMPDSKALKDRTAHLLSEPKSFVARILPRPAKQRAKRPYGAWVVAKKKVTRRRRANALSPWVISGDNVKISTIERSVVFKGWGETSKKLTVCPMPQASTEIAEQYAIDVKQRDGELFATSSFEENVATRTTASTSRRYPPPIFMDLLKSKPFVLGVFCPLVNILPSRAPLFLSTASA